VAAVLGGAKPLVDLIWQRETENQVLDTPERRAGLERRLNEVTREIKDETLRRYYVEDLRARLSALFGRGGANGAPACGQQPGGARGGFQRGRQGAGRGFGQLEGLQGYRNAPLQMSASLTRSSLMGSGIPQREALILLVLLNHPELVLHHAEDLSSLELNSRDAAALRDGLLTLATSPMPDHLSLKAAVDAAGLAEARQKIEAFTALASMWCVKAEAAKVDADALLGQALALHRKARALHRELQLAEVALGNEASEENLARLRDIQEQLSALAGTEAALEGFGALSGRQSRAL
jgi:DNA primase